MPSFADSIFLFVLALLLFGPKKLPVLARELGKWMGEFRRASNEFKMQIDEELRASEQAERQKKIAAMESAAPIPPPLDEPAEPEHPHMRYRSQEPSETAAEGGTASTAHGVDAGTGQTVPPVTSLDTPATVQEAEDDTRPVPIASSGDLHMMPPATGLPIPRSSGGSGALNDFVGAIPKASESETSLNNPGLAEENIAHVE